MLLDQLRGDGELITTSEVVRISPLPHQHIHTYGHYPFDLANRPTGYRPLRASPQPVDQPVRTPNRV